MQRDGQLSGVLFMDGISINFILFPGRVCFGNMIKADISQQSTSYINFKIFKTYLCERREEKREIERFTIH